MNAQVPNSRNLKSKIKSLRSEWLLGVALLLGMGLRLAFVWHGADIGGSPLILDEGNYIGSAVSLAQGQGIPDRWLWERPPLYILFAAANFVLFGKEGTGNLFALGLMQTLLSLFSIWLVWGITRLLFPLRPLAAGFAALLLAIAPAPVFYANVYMSETLYIALLLVWLYCMLRWQQGEQRLVPTKVGVGEQGEPPPAPTEPDTQSPILSPQSSRPHSTLNNPHFILAAGAFAGAMLTRSLLLYFLPLLLGWMVWQGRAEWRRAVVQAVGFAAIVFVLILPWTVRNGLQYGRFILIDTTGQINLYIDNGPLSRADAYARLGRIPNLGDRADFAQREGVATILADPTRFAGAAWARLSGTWRVDLFTEFQAFLARKYPSTSGTTELWYALAGGGFHLLFFLLAIIGLAFAWGDRAAKGLVLLLAALHTLTTLLAHPEYRYVIPFFAVFAPWAGWVLAGVLAPRHWRYPSPLPLPPLSTARDGSPDGGLPPPSMKSIMPTSKLKAQNLVMAAVAIGWLLYSSVPVLGGYMSGTRAAYRVLRANVANLLGDANGEAGQVTLALAEFDAANLRTWLGDIRRGQGDIASASSLYQQASASDPNYWPAALSWGAARRQQGDIAGAAAAFDKVKAEYRARAQTWAFDHLGDVTATADVGQADYGYVRGSFEPEREGERTYRWTTANAAVRLYTAAPATTITLTLRASRANQSLRISVNGQQLGNYQPTLEWQSINISLPTNLREAHRYTVELATEARPASAQDTRALGVALDVVGVK